MSMESVPNIKSVPKAKNRLIELEARHFQTLNPHGSERQRAKLNSKSQLLRIIFEHYCKEYGQMIGKDILSDEEVTAMRQYVSSIPAEQIIQLVEGWQQDWGAGEYDKQDDDNKLSIDAADDLIADMSTW